MDPETAVFLQFLELNVIQKQADQTEVRKFVIAQVCEKSWWRNQVSEPAGFGPSKASASGTASRGLDAKYLCHLGFRLGTRIVGPALI